MPHKGVNGRDSNAQRMGVKAYGGEAVRAGSIILRQRGTHIHADRNVGQAKDYSLFALTDGLVHFRVFKGKKFVSVLTQADQEQGRGVTKATQKSAKVAKQDSSP